jgi:hypothetical protein
MRFDIRQPRIFSVLTIAFLMFGSVASGTARGNGPAVDEAKALELLDELEPTPSGKTAGARAESSAEVPAEVPEDVMTAYHDALKASYARDKWSAEFKQRIYEWQLTSSKVVFVVVVLLVAAGVVFAAIQFWVGLVAARTLTSRGRELGDPVVGHGADPRDAAVQTAPDVSGTIEASAAGLKVTTPVLGVIILTLSLLFFYLYLKFVYPIT